MPILNVESEDVILTSVIAEVLRHKPTKEIVIPLPFLSPENLCIAVLLVDPAYEKISISVKNGMVLLVPPP